MKSRWLIFAPVAILALFSTVSSAESIQGLNTTYYVIDEIPPAQSTTDYEECGSELENNINRSYDGEPYEECTGDLFMVHMTGFITIPEHETIEFFLASDDGGEITIGDNTFGLWQDQGCSATMSGNLTIEAGSQPLELWMYENGGGTCVMLAWKIDDNDWEIVPEWAFTTESTPQTTTSITTVQTSIVPVTDLVTTTLVQELTTSSELATTTSLTEQTSTVPETTTTTEYVSPPVAQPPVVVQPEPIEEPTTIDTMPEMPEIETFPPETLELPPDTYPTIEPPDTLPFVGELPGPPDTIELPPDIVLEPPVILPIELIEELPPELVQVLEDASEDVSLTEEQFDMVVESIEDLAPEEAVALIEQILNTDVTPEQATELASNPDVLAVVTSEQAEEIFETLDVTELDNTQIDALVEAVQSAPVTVRKAFEKTINVFDDGLGDYVPIGSNVPVDTRRTLIAVAAGVATVAAGQRRGK